MNDTVNDFKVTDRQTFIKFLDLLRKDFLDNPENWENKTLPDFLEALSAYTKDVQGYYDNMKLDIKADKPDWSTFADIFKGNNRIGYFCFSHNITSLKYIWKFFPESVVVENTKDENYNKFNCKHKTFRFVCIERSVVEETVAVAVYEKVNRIDKHELVEKRRIKAVGVVHNTR